MNDNEIWRPILGYEGMYEVSNYGSVKTLQRVLTRKNRMGNITVKEKIKVPNISKYGYATIALVKQNVTHTTYLHRIIAIAFIEKPDGTGKYVVNHKDGNKLNNSLDNLEWVTSAENNAHAVRIGLRATRKYMTKNLLESIIELKKEKLTHKVIAQKLNLTCAIVWGVVNGRTYQTLLPR